MWRSNFFPTQIVIIVYNWKFSWFGFRSNKPWLTVAHLAFVLLSCRTGNCVGLFLRRTRYVTTLSVRLRSQSELWICASAKSALNLQKLNKIILSLWYFRGVRSTSELRRLLMLMSGCILSTGNWYSSFTCIVTLTTSAFEVFEINQIKEYKSIRQSSIMWENLET